MVSGHDSKSSAFIEWGRAIDEQAAQADEAMRVAGLQVRILQHANGQLQRAYNQLLATAKQAMPHIVPDETYASVDESNDGDSKASNGHNAATAAVMHSSSSSSSSSGNGMNGFGRHGHHIAATTTISSHGREIRRRKPHEAGSSGSAAATD